MSYRFMFFIRTDEPVKAAERLTKWLAGQSDYEASVRPQMTSVEVVLNRKFPGIQEEKIISLFKEVANG